MKNDLVGNVPKGGGLFRGRSKRLGLLMVAALLMLLLFMQTMVLADQHNTVLLPVGGDDMYAVSLMSDEDTVLYASTGVVSIELPEISTDIAGNTLARVQAVNSHGVVVAQTAADTIGHWGEFDSTDLYMFEKLAVGKYQLKMVYGDINSLKSMDLPYVMQVLDAPVITGGWLDLYAGDTKSSVGLYIDGYAGKPDNYQFTLINADDFTEIACSAVCTESDERHYGHYGVEWELTPATELVQYNKYYLQVTAKSGSIYSNADRISDTAFVEYEPAVAVLTVTSNSDVTGGLIVTAGGLSADTKYAVTVTIGAQYDGEVLYSGEVTPEMKDGIATFKPVLKKNGLVLPINIYGSNGIYVNVSTIPENEYEDPESDCLCYYNMEGYFEQYANLELTKTGTGVYEYYLTGYNMLLDVYEDNNTSFTLKSYNESTRKYTAVNATFSAVTKSTRNSGNDAYFNFKGTIKTKTELTNGTYYALCYGDEVLAMTYTVRNGSTSADAKLSLDYLDIRQHDFSSNSFWFNFDRLIVEAYFDGAGDTVTMQLVDVSDDNKVVATSETATEDSDGKRQFILTKPADFAVDHSYTLTFVSGKQSVSASDFGSEYAKMTYDTAVVEPDYCWVINDKLFVGDTTVKLSLSNYDIKNVSVNYFETNKLNVVNMATEIGVKVSDVTVSYQDYYWAVECKLEEQLTYGSYVCSDTNGSIESDMFTVLNKGIPVLGDADKDYNTGTVSLVDCRNLSAKAKYTGTLYSANSEALSEPKALTLKYVSETELFIENLPSDLANGFYTVEVMADGTYIGAVSCYISWGSDEATVDGPDIRPQHRVQYDEYWNYEDILYFTDADKIALKTYMSGYAYVRYSEDKSFKNVSYNPVRDCYDQEMTLSSGNGEKTIYVQFKNGKGEESSVYSVVIKKVEAVAEPKIVSAKILVDGKEVERVPDFAEFTLSMVSDSQLTSAYAKFIESDGSTYYGIYPLLYGGQTDDGYLFTCTFDSSDWPFHSDIYSFEKVDCYLTDLAGDKECSKKTLPISFGVRLSLDDWDYDWKPRYENTGDFTVSGNATAGAEVTIVLDKRYDDYEETFTGTAGTDGKFSIKLSDVPNGNFDVRVEAEASGDYTGLDRNLCVDTVAPIINSLKAVSGENGNTVLSWDCTESGYYLIWRDGLLIKSADDDYAYNSYIALNADGAVFKIVAVDDAGNRSEPKQITVNGDEIAPTAPGTPTLVAHGSKSITFNWVAATDNVAVYQYLVYRDDSDSDSDSDSPLATLSYDVTSYTDSALNGKTGYTYTVYAVDKAGNKSDGASAALAVAELKIAESTTLKDEYIKEENTKGIAVTMSLDTTDTLYDLSAAVGKLQYKLADAVEWSELALTKTTDGKYSGTWLIEDLAVGDYTVRFAAVDAEGSETFTDGKTVKITQDNVPPTVKLGSPYGEDVRGGKDILIVADASDNVGVAKIVVSYAAKDSSEFTEIVTLTNEAQGKKYSPAAYTWQATDLASGKYTVRAVAYDLRGNESTAAENVITLDNTPPAAPTGVTVTGTSRYIHVMWDTSYVTPDDFKHFNVYRAEAVDGEYTLVSETNTVGYFDDGKTADAGKTYYYYVTAEDKYGNESAKNAADIKSAQMVSDTESPTIGDMQPKDNALLRRTASIRVTAADNYRLSKMVLEYCESNGADAGGSETWHKIAEVPVNGIVNNTTFGYDWNLDGIASGDYKLRATVYDASIDDVAEDSGYTANAPVQVVRNVKILPYNAPKAPAATVSNGYKEAVISWTYSGDVDTLSRFVIYQTDEKGEQGRQVATASAGKSGSYTAKLELTGTSYFVVAAVDSYGASANSNVIAAATVGADTENPVAVIMPEVLTAAVGVPFDFSAAGSYDNDVIASYSWNFGDDASDNNSGNGYAVKHTYAAAGTYTVTLTVKDETGNSGTATKDITVYGMTAEDAGYALVTLNVVNGYAQNTPAVAGAELKFFNAENGTDGFETTVAADNKGQTTVIVPVGEITVSAVADGYIAATRTVNVEPDENGKFTYTLALTPVNVSMVDGSLSHTEMTREEIIAAGIDMDDPDNNHVWKFEATFNFTATLGVAFDLPVTGYFNSAGKLVGGSGWGWSSLGSLSGGGAGGLGGGLNVGIFPISENFVLVIYGEAHWLKEMYNVELVVINNSYVDDITDCIATLELPEGLSLAGMLGDQQTATVNIGTVSHKFGADDGANIAKANWYVRGDEAGEYNLSATVTGRNPEEFCKTFTTDKPVKVYAGNALHLQITADDVAFCGEEYRVRFKLSNVSDKEIYNLSFGITGAEQFKVVQLGDSVGKIELNQDDFADNMTQKVDVLKPGGNIEIDFWTTTWFNSVLELSGLAGLGPVEVQYLLTNVFVTTLEGSTTSIPYSISYNHVSHGTFYEWLNDEAKDALDEGALSLLDKAYLGDFGILKNGVKIYKFVHPGDTTDTASRALIYIENGYCVSADGLLPDESEESDESGVEEQGIALLDADADSNASLNTSDGAVLVYTDAPEGSYTISADGKTMTIDGSATVYVKGQNDGKAKMVVTTYVKDETTGDFAPNTYTLNYTVGNGGSSGGSSGGGGGGGGGTVSNTTTSTTTNSDGSVTTIVTDKTTSTVTETTKYKDGSSVTVVTKKDGSSTVTEKTADGVEVKTVTTAAGKITADIKVSGAADGATVDVPADLGKAPGKVSVRVRDSKTGKTTTVPATYADGKITFAVSGSAHIEVLDDFVADNSGSNGIQFVDVSTKAYYYDAVLWAVSGGITSGVDATHFGAEESCTRAQLVTFLWRAAGCPVVDYAMKFVDVPEDAYYAEAVRWAASLNIVTGYSDTVFGSNDSITREQVAAILYRYAEAMKYDTTQGGMAVREFADWESVADYAKAAFQWSVNAGIIKGDNNRLLPADKCVRGQIVTMMYRLLG